MTEVEGLFLPKLPKVDLNKTEYITYMEYLY